MRRPDDWCASDRRVDIVRREALDRKLGFPVGFGLEFTPLQDRKRIEVSDDHD